MKIVILTSNATRHKYLANQLAKNVDDALVISECKTHDGLDMDSLDRPLNPIEKHFYERYMTEQEFFTGNDYFETKTVPILYKEVNLKSIYAVVEKFNPDMIFVFGSSIIREPLLSAAPTGKFVNLHLGISPYYRGSGTNFWPFVNQELEFVGSTVIYIDKGVDTGDIITHVRPKIEAGDNVHTVGCKVVESSVAMLQKIIHAVKEGATLPRAKQWKEPNAKYYSKKDFNEEILQKYKNNMERGLIDDYLKNGSKHEVKLIHF